MVRKRDLHERASFNLNVYCAMIAIERDYKDTEGRMEILLLMMARGWHHVTYGSVTVDHLISPTGLTEREVNKYLKKLKARGWIAREGKYIALTDAGRAEERRLKGAWAREFKQFQKNLEHGDK